MAGPSRCALVLLGLLVLSAPSVAAGPWVVRVEGGTTDYSSRTFSSYQSDSSELRLDGGQGLGVAAEYRPSPLIGVELSLSQIDLDADWNQVRFYLDVQHDGVERDQYTGIRLSLFSAALSYRIGGRP